MNQHPDPACHFDADLDLDPACPLDADPTFHFVADPDPDPDPSFQIKAQNHGKVFKWAHILACHLQVHVDADPDPNPAYHFEADSDPDPDSSLSRIRIRKTGFHTSVSTAGEAHTVTRLSSFTSYCNRYRNRGIYERL